MLLFFSITLVEYVLFWTFYIVQFPHFSNISHAFPFLYGVFLYFFFRQIFLNKSFNFRRDAGHFLPALIVFIYDLPFYCHSGAIKKLLFLGKMSVPKWQYLLTQYVIPVAQIISMSAYLGVVIFLFQKISRTQVAVKQWFVYITSLFALFVVSFASYYFLVWLGWLTPTWDYMISFSMTIFIYALLWLGYLQNKTFNGYGLTENVEKVVLKYRSSSLTKSAAQELAEKLDFSMRENQWYLESDLSLERLSVLVGTNKHSLSQVLNEKMGMNFFDYINSLRIEEAAKMLGEKSKSELNIIEIAYRVGFNNKVTFNATFKKIKGMTPTEFRQRRGMG